MVASMGRIAAVCLAASSAFAAAAAAQPACPPQDPAAPIEAMRAMYAAVEAGDEPAIKELIVPGFYAFEGGVRMDRATLLGQIQGAQKAGRVYHWSVNDPDVRMSCAVAWVAYVNKGSATDAAGVVRPVTWLESAGVGFERGRWRVLFLNSTRVPAPKP